MECELEKTNERCVKIDLCITLNLIFRVIML
jgi:hypothetical protein